jgi:CoA-transferase family III
MTSTKETQPTRRALEEVWATVDGSASELSGIRLSGPDPALPSVFCVTSAAGASIAAATLGAAALLADRNRETVRGVQVIPCTPPSPFAANATCACSTASSASSGIRSPVTIGQPTAGYGCTTAIALDGGFGKRSTVLDWAAAWAHHRPALRIWPGGTMGPPSGLRQPRADGERSCRRGASGGRHGSPVALPCQALDHASGYLLALGVLTGLRRRQREGRSWHIAVSLARTARWLDDLDRVDGGLGVVEPDPLVVADCLRTDATPWGRVEHVSCPGMIDGSTVFADSGDVTLAPGTGVGGPKADTGKNAVNDDYYCKFIGSSVTIRGSLNVQDPDGVDREVIPAQ